MVKEELINKIAEALFEEETILTKDTVLEELEGWDSLGRLGIVALVKEEFGKTIDSKSLFNCKKVEDIMKLVYL
ncbi:acyl carrier protein [Neobacillus drentensis]|uniref:acyl carrier protein n=1 Tax=Neobacillus drentensis TaxID=220684 RepID=UPI002FFFA569